MFEKVIEKVKEKKRREKENDLFSLNSLFNTKLEAFKSTV